MEHPVKQLIIIANMETVNIIVLYYEGYHSDEYHSDGPRGCYWEEYEVKIPDNAEWNMGDYRSKAQQTVREQVQNDPNYVSLAIKV